MNLLAIRLVLSDLQADNQSLIDSFRVARALAEKEDDSSTSSLVDDWIDQTEERAWFLRQATVSA